MSRELATDEKQQVKRPEPVDQALPKQRPAGPTPAVAAMIHLQKQVGNRAVQRLLAQRQVAGDGFELDDATAGRINQARGGGQPLDGVAQEKMSDSLGYDFSGVRVHTSAESDELNHQLSAKAFTTGQDIFFSQGTYEPNSSAGQELLAHELTHVVQQGSGRVGGGGSGMTVRPAGDAFEQEADALASQAAAPGSEAGAQATAGAVQRAGEEEELQLKPIQRAGEEEELQMKPIQRAGEEEELQMKPIQRADEEDKLQLKPIQRADEEDELQMKPIQREGEEDELQLKPIQRADEEEEELQV